MWFLHTTTENVRVEPEDWKKDAEGVIQLARPDIIMAVLDKTYTGVVSGLYVNMDGCIKIPRPLCMA